jgi:hypothetical protein
LAIVGFTYAHWSETLWLNGKVTTGNMCAEFVQGSVIQKDPFGPNNDWTCDDGLTNIRQLTKNIGHTNCTLIDTNNDGCKDTLKIDMGNVYPSYYEHIAWKIHNCGTIPWKIWRVIFNPGNIIINKTGPILKLDLNNDQKPDIEIDWGNNFGDQVDPCENIDLSADFHILQPIPQDSTLTFTITIEIVNWNEYPPA